MIPRPALVVLAALGLPLAVLAIWSDTAIPAWIALNAAVALLATFDLIRGGATVRAGRDFATVQGVGRDFPVRIWVDNLSRRSLRVLLTDDTPGLATGLPLDAQIGPGRRFESSYQARIDRRGLHAFGPVTVRWRSPWGLWERQRRLPVASEAKVFPDFTQLRRLDLETRLVQDQAPVRARRRPGGENEFERLRPYVAGDPMKHIDWKATARRRELVTREYGQEANQNLIFLLDCGRTMGQRSGQLLAFDHALNAAVMMSEVALRRGDRVGLLAFDEKVRAWLPPRGGSRSGSRIIRGIYDLSPSLSEPDYALALRHLGQRVRRRSLIVVLTSVIDQPSAEAARALVTGLAKRHLVVTVWLRDPTLDRWLDEPGSDPIAPWRRGAAAELVDQRETALASLGKLGVHVVDCPTGALAPQLVSSYLEIKSRRLLG